MESPHEWWRSQLSILGGLYWGFLKYPEPYSAVDGSDALFNLWKKRMIRKTENSAFWRVPQILAIIVLIAILLYGEYSYPPPVVRQGLRINPITQFIMITFLFFITYRIQICTVPAIVSWYEFNRINREILRTTLITPSEIFRAMYRTTWTLSVFQFSVIMTLWVILYSMHNTGFWISPQNVLMLFLEMIFIGFILVAMGYFGYFVLKNIFGIFLGVMIPLIPGLYVMADAIFLGKAYKYPSSSDVTVRGFLVLIGFPDAFFFEYAKGDVLIMSWAFLAIVALSLWILIRIFINKNMKRV